MSPAVTCDCALCDIEARLLSELTQTEAGALREFFSSSLALRQYSSVSSLLAHLKASPVESQSDELLRELFTIRQRNTPFVEKLLFLAFLPMLHAATRRVARQQPALSKEDIKQQALSFLLQYLHSNEFQMRQSHFAFAISRAVKRRLFEWAQRESGKTRLLNHYNGETTGELVDEEPVERHALLHHFLHRCVTKRLLTAAELELLFRYKLNGTSGEEIADFNGTSSNAVRQRLKRLLAKLRRLAR